MARGILSAVGALVLLLAPAAQARKPLVRDEMRNTRYCEIFTVDLAPVAVATVWNSLGLNSCPQAWWDGLDTRALAAEHGDDLALLNGPRSFIMDRAKAKDYGPVTTFAGKRMRDVAAIDLATVGLAPPPAFTDVRIDRRNTWTWDAGKKVFELRRPERARLRDAVLLASGRPVAELLGPARTRAAAGAAGGLDLPGATTQRRPGADHERQGDDHPGRVAQHLPAAAARAHAIVVRSSPSCGELTTTSSPGRSQTLGSRAPPTPAGVPVATTSPGSSARPVMASPADLPL